MLYAMEKFSPSHVGRGGFARVMRLTGVVGLFGGFLAFYNRSISTLQSLPTGTKASTSIGILTILLPYTVRFYGLSENAREVQMDMREMVDKVKRGEPLYGVSQLEPHMQGVAARQSRFSGLFSDVVPWFNFVNHPQHGVDTAKYYRQAEKELEAEQQSKAQGEAATLG